MSDWMPWDHTTHRNRRLPEDAYTTPGKAVFFTIRAHRGRPFNENDDLCRTVCELLASMRVEYGCWVGAYCLMPDHLHLVTSPNEEGRSVVTYIERFKGRTTNASWPYGWTGKLWQARFHDHAVRAVEDLDQINAYILDNPVRAGLVELPEDWPWSGILDPQE